VTDPTAPAGSGESWLQLRVEVPRDRVPAAEALLERLGALVTWTENAGAAPVLEPGPGDTPLWDRVWLTGLFPRDLDEALLRVAIAGDLGADPAGIQASVVADRDWDADWRRQLRPLKFGRRLWVCPGEHPCPEPEGIAIRLDPGMAFGTGTHPTTAMCLEWLDAQELRQRRVLDYGCGSGILAVAALALGAAAATGVDNDPQALAASRENGQRNGCGDRLTVLDPAALPPGGGFPVVVANILSGILVRLEPVLRAQAAPGACLALTGILADQAAEVAAAYRPWAELTVTAEKDGWVLLSGRAKP
jgi:ribosomal protein L11 methyltransferase